MKPAYDSFVLPTSRYADIVCPEVDYTGSSLTYAQIVPGSNNNVAIDLITTHIRKKLEEHRNVFRGNMIYSPIHENTDLLPDDPSETFNNADIGIHVLKESPQLKVRQLLAVEY